MCFAYLNNVDLSKSFCETCFAIQDDLPVLGVGQVFDQGRLCQHGFQDIRQSVVTASFPIFSLQISEELLQDVIGSLRLYGKSPRLGNNLNGGGEQLIPVFINLLDHFPISGVFRRQIVDFSAVAKPGDTLFDSCDIRITVIIQSGTLSGTPTTI